MNTNFFKYFSLNRRGNRTQIYEADAPITRPGPVTQKQ